jgi:hypothetical protein
VVVWSTKSVAVTAGPSVVDWITLDDLRMFLEEARGLPGSVSILVSRLEDSVEHRGRHHVGRVEAHSPTGGYYRRPPAGG